MTQNQINKAKALAWWQALDAAAPDGLPEVCAGHLPEDFLWQGPAPLGNLTGSRALAEQVWTPLKRAIPDLTRQSHLFFGGHSPEDAAGGTEDAMWVCGTGYLTGTATGAFLGIPATDTPLRIRWGEFIRFDGSGQMISSQVILDFIDWFEQIGLPVLPPPRGAAHVYPAPTGYDGVLTGEQDAPETRETFETGHRFIYGGLNSFDESDLGSMGMAGWFHPNIKWYGPGGIGACLSLQEFQDRHQQPWLTAFPDRKVKGLESLFAEGPLLGASGVAGVAATHTGPYLGQPPTGRKLEVSGLDFWFRQGNQFVENWVFVDMIHLFDQMGVDLFARMKERAQAKDNAA